MSQSTVIPEKLALPIFQSVSEISFVSVTIRKDLNTITIWFVSYPFSKVSGSVFKNEKRLFISSRRLNIGLFYFFFSKL